MAGMNELNQRVQNAQARATAAERQAQATQQELARSQPGVQGKGESAAVPQQQEQGIGAFASKCQPQPFEGADDNWREWARVSFSQLLWTSFWWSADKILRTR